MYQILLVDDERPALNYLDAIVKKYLPDFEVCAMAEDAKAALSALSRKHVDVIITDISMPGGMNGIELAKAAKKKTPLLHIVIVSGYAEFEYARGALQAGVEDYLLKPVSISRVKEIMEKVRAELDEGRQTMKQKTIAELAAQKRLPPETIERSFGREAYGFALVRFGNLNDTRHSRLISASPCHLNEPDWLPFYGHDEEELILLLPEGSFTGRFSAKLTELLERICAERKWTAIYDPNTKPVRFLADFLSKAYELMNLSLTIGVSRCLCVQASAPVNRLTIPGSVLKQLASHMMNGSGRAIQELFLSLAVEWENAGVTQDQLEHLCFQIINQVANEGGLAGKKTMKDAGLEAEALCAGAGSVGEVLSGLYGILFGDLSVHDKKISGEELCEYTLEYIRANYAFPLSIQTICAKIGFSQTYLSRLLRKYAGTSVNTYLTQCRIDAARKLLESNPDMLLRDVASAAGYDDQSYFNKIFRNETGMTPKQYAAQFRERKQGEPQ